MYFVAGVSLLTANGMAIPDLENTTIKVGFPNSIYLTVEHGTADETFSFDFWYLDQDTNEAREDPIDGYMIEIKEVERFEQADIMWVVIIGSTIAALLLCFILYVCCRVDK